MYPMYPQVLWSSEVNLFNILRDFHSISILYTTSGHSQRLSGAELLLAVVCLYNLSRLLFQFWLSTAVFLSGFTHLADVHGA